jgi:hypothetical protein
MVGSQLEEHPMSKLFCAGIALLLAVGVTQLDDKAGKKADEQAQYAFGVIRSLDVKGGVGTLTILGSKRKKDRPMEMNNVADAFRNSKFLWILFTGEGNNLTATVVNVTA